MVLSEELGAIGGQLFDHWDSVRVAQDDLVWKVPNSNINVVRENNNINNQNANVLKNTVDVVNNKRQHVEVNSNSNSNNNIGVEVSNSKYYSAPSTGAVLSPSAITPPPTIVNHKANKNISP